MYDLFGSVVPDLRAVIFSFFFPTGFSGILYGSLLLGISLILYFFSQRIKNKAEPDESIKEKQTSLEIVGTIILGITIPPLCGFFCLYLILKSCVYAGDIRKSRKSILSNLYFLFNILLLLLLIIGPMLLALLKYDLFFILFEIGIIIGIVYVLKKRSKGILRDLPLFTLAESSKRKFKTIFLLIAITFSSVMIGAWFLKEHSGAPKSQDFADIDITLVSYNVRNGIANDGLDSWETRKDKFVDHLDSFDADIISLQEAYFFQIRYILDNSDNKNYEFTGLGRDDGGHSGEHTPILYDKSKYELIDGDTFWFNDIPSIPGNGYRDEANCNRICTWARFKVKDTKYQFCVFSTHYGFGREFRKRAGHLLQEKIEDYTGGLPTFLLGDFNLGEGDYGYEKIIESDDKPLESAYNRINGLGPHKINTFNGFDPNYDESDKKIDFIFVSSKIRVKSCEIARDTYKGTDGERHTYSDHYPIVADCVI